jgi:peptidoglycan hydrolase-like protein with peptidoglycan-binding domain
VNRRLLIALLVLLLAIVTPLAACGGGDDGEAVDSTETEDIGALPTETEPIPPAPTDTGVDTLPIDPVEPVPPATSGGNVPQVKVLTPPLQLGDRGNRVKTLQKVLVALGLLDEGAADGDFGKKTKTAVQAFQLANGLKADGIAGKATLRRLNKAVREGETYADSATDTTSEPAPSQPETETGTGTETESTG